MPITLQRAKTMCFQRYHNESKMDHWRCHGFLLIGYVYRVYTVNTSDAVKYATPTVLKYQSSEAVELRPGYYNIGYIDLSGYYINVTGARIQKCRIS